MWWPNGASTSKPIQGLAPGTYYWQVKTATTGTEANTGTWWTFTVGAQVTSFSKTTPPNGGVLTANVAPLSWTAAEGAQFYEVCVDAIDNGDCDTAWVSNAVSPHRLFGGLTDGTYYWQVRVTTAEGQAWANDGAWWTIHVDAPNPIREYIYLGGKLLASLSFTPTTSVLTYYHTDALGSVRAITDASGNPLVRHDYAAFGEGTPLQGDPRRFLGQERDFESGLDHFGAREYQNIWGRFTAVDPILRADYVADPQLFNRFGHARSNPLRYSDTTGLEVVVQDATACNLVRDSLPEHLQKYVVWKNGRIDPTALAQANTLDPLFMALLSLIQSRDALVVSSGAEFQQVIKGSTREGELYYDSAGQYHTGLYVPSSEGVGGRAHIYLFDKPGNIPPVPRRHMLLTTAEEIAHATLSFRGEEYRHGAAAAEEYIRRLRASVGKR